MSLSRMLFAIGLPMAAVSSMKMTFDAHDWGLTILVASGWAAASYWIGALSPRAHNAHPDGGESGTCRPMSQDVV